MTGAEALALVEQPTEAFHTADPILVVDAHQHYRVAWLLDGRRKTRPTGPRFKTPGAAARLIDLMNGDHP